VTNSRSTDCAKNELLDGDRHEANRIIRDRCLELTNLLSVLGCFVTDGVAVEIEESHIFSCPNLAPIFTRPLQPAQRGSGQLQNLALAVARETKLREVKRFADAALSA
jgi:hypothetical protein